MALGNHSQVIYLNIVNGKIARRFSSPIEGRTITRKTESGKEVHEELFGYVSGILTGIELTKHEEYGEFMNLYLNDDGEVYVLQIGVDSGYGTSLLKTFPNVNIGEKLTLIPKMTVEPTGKKTSVMFVQQGNKKALKRYYTKDTPGLPQPKSVTFQGKERWDYYDQMEFLKKNVLEPIMSKLKHAIPPTGNAHPEAAPAPVDKTDDINAPDDDLPF